MKRAFYEWSAITASALALIRFIYWAVSMFTPAVDFEVFLPLGTGIPRRFSRPRER